MSEIKVGEYIRTKDEILQVEEIGEGWIKFKGYACSDDLESFLKHNYKHSFNIIDLLEENEIKVGEYVRTEDGYIAKVVEITNEMIYFDNNICERVYFPKEKYKILFIEDLKSITKHSPNIIDLIEVGDYVNGSRVIANEKGVVWTIEDDFELEHIKTIVTKEQFAESEYKV